MIFLYFSNDTMKDKIKRLYNVDPVLSHKCKFCPCEIKFFSWFFPSCLPTKFYLKFIQFTLQNIIFLLIDENRTNWEKIFECHIEIYPVLRKYQCLKYSIVSEVIFPYFYWGQSCRNSSDFCIFIQFVKF